MGNKNKKGQNKKGKTQRPVRILITGFDGFPDNPDNPSKILVKSLARIFSNHSGINVKALVLKTEYDSAYCDLRKEIKDFAPDMIIQFGVRASGKGFDIESTARNQAGNQPDAQNMVHKSNHIKEDSPKTLRSNLPLRTLKENLKRKGLPARISKSAGDYLCNYIFYRLMLDIYSGKLNCKGGFVHIPHSTQTATHYEGEHNITPLSCEQLEKGGRAIIETAARYLNLHRES